MVVKLDQVSPIALPWLPSSPARSTPTLPSPRSAKAPRGTREDGRFPGGCPGCKRRPGEKQARELGNVLYALHLAILLYWFHDRTPEARATRELVGPASETLRYLRPALRFPPMSRVLSRLAGALGDIGMNATAPTAEESGGAR